MSADPPQISPIAALTLAEQDVRGALTRFIAVTGRGPAHAELASTLGMSVAAVEAALDRLHAAHALLLHPHERRVWVAHPFALSAGSCWVQTAEHGYWANCLYCALGIAAATRRDAVITTRLGGEHELLFHLSTPVCHWWDNVIAACASFQPFRNEADIASWCQRHDMPRGHVMDLPSLWAFASDWYGDYVEGPWRKRSADAVRAVFDAHGLTSDFWRLNE
jgi:Alkylmercury lyase